MISCDKTAESTVLLPKKLIDVSYGTDSLQKFDYYLPISRDTANTKVIILIHGGSWISGDKSEFSDIITQLSTNLGNYAIFNLNYRLANPTNGQNFYPVQYNDILSAIKVIIDSQNNFKVNTSKITIMGASAGAQLGMLVGFKSEYKNRVKNVVDIFGPSDMLGLIDYYKTADPQSASLLGLYFGNSVTQIAEASPINYVTSTTAPTLILHGNTDSIVPISQSDILDAKLTKFGIQHKYVIYPNQGHGFTGASLSDALYESILFIKKYNP
jgi:acetyl esterase/lipase